MPAVITTTTTTGHIASPFSLSGTGFGASPGTLLLFPGSGGEFIGVATDTWGDTAITGSLPSFGVDPAPEAFFVVIPDGSDIGGRGESFALLAEAVVAAAELIPGLIVTVPIGTEGEAFGPVIQPVPPSIQGETAGSVMSVDTGGGVLTARWSLDVTNTDDYEMLQVALDAVRVKGTLTGVQQLALGNVFYQTGGVRVG